PRPCAPGSVRAARGARVRSLRFAATEHAQRVTPPVVMALLILILLAQAGALSWVVRKGDLEATRAMLALGADPNKRDPFRATPLFWAVSKNHADVTVLLLDYNA